MSCLFNWLNSVKNLSLELKPYKIKSIKKNVRRGGLNEEEKTVVGAVWLVGTRHTVLLPLPDYSLYPSVVWGPSY